MKITDSKSYPVWVGHRNQMLVTIEMDRGVRCKGESGLSVSTSLGEVPGG